MVLSITAHRLPAGEPEGDRSLSAGSCRPLSPPFSKSLMSYFLLPKLEVKSSFSIYLISADMEDYSLLHRPLSLGATKYTFAVVFHPPCHSFSIPSVGLSSSSEFSKCWRTSLLNPEPPHCLSSLDDLAIHMALNSIHSICR